MPSAPVDTAILVTIGPCVDDTDFKTLETAIAYDAAGMSVDLLKNSITGAASKTDLTLTTAGTQDWVALGNGVYSLEITAAQNDTEGELRVVGVATGVLPFESPVYTIVPLLVYNSMVAGSDNLQVDAIQVSGDATAADNAELMFDGTGYAGGTTKLGVDAVAISGDTTAADNAELMFDGTGYAGGTTKLSVSVADLAAGAITAAAIATGAIDADALAADAVTEIWNKTITVSSATAATIMKAVYAMARGKIAKSGDNYTTYDDDNSTAIDTLTISTTGRTVA